jgi:tetratricopeptide (TPR) repeat protein
MSRLIPLGPFDLLAPLARGGMGTVWRGIHREGRLPVAVKVVVDADEELEQALQHEVRAVAGLDHPHIIRIWEQGRVDRAAARASEGKLPLRSPWFAMELADGGRIGTGAPPRWTELREQLLQLLSALAHAHARGILHRDIKPGNVLFSVQGGIRSPKLTDFGVGWRLDGPAGPIRGGTPHWMAPEQFLDDRGLQGPWTDLYALGCLTYALVAGQPPFRSGPSTAPGHFEELREAHLHRSFPLLPEGSAVPPGFHAWLAGLVAKDPGERWPHAADAAAALARLPAPALELPSVSLEEAPTVQIAPRTGATLELAARGAGGRRLRPGPPPPFPADWRAVGAPPAGGVRLGGVGLGLVGLRPIPVVGRAWEQDQAWAALREVARDGQPRLVLLEGHAGFGKSRLAEWLAVTAEEAGAALGLRAAYGAEQGLREGLPGLVARHYRLDPALDRRGVHDEIARLLRHEGETDPHEPFRVAALLRPERGDEGQTEEQRALVVERLIRRKAVDRPVLVWLDDAHHSLEGLAFVRRLLSHGLLPVLVVVTVQDEALAERPAVAQALDGLLAAAPERVTRLRLGPLIESERARLVQELLGLTGELAARVEARTEGNPLFATQLVGDWVQRGLLEATPLGFRLQDGVQPPLPESISSLWDRRIAASVRGAGDRWRGALEIAAVLGQQVELEEWRSAAMMAGLSVPEALVSRLLQQRLMRVEPGYPRRLSFAHGLLRESLLHAAAEGGRTGRWHRAAAGMVRVKGGPDADERAGRHLLGAGDLDAAAPWLLAAVQDRTRAGEAPAALELAAQLAAALGSAPERQAWRAELAVLRAQALRVLGHLAEARALVDPFAALAAQLPPRTRVHVLREHALARLHTAGVSEELYGWLAEAREAAWEVPAPTLAADIDIEEGRALEYHGRVKEAGSAYSRALSLYEAHADRRGEGDARLGLASVANKEGRHDEAVAQATAAMARLTEQGSAWRILYCQTLLGEIARYRGDLEQAEGIYREVIARYERLVSPRQTALPRTNLALVLAAAGRFEEAARTLLEAEQGAQESGHVNLQRMVTLLRAWPAAALGDWAAVDRGLEVGEGLLAERVVDPDLARAAEQAGQLAKAAGQGRRARWAAFLAERLHSAISG